MPIASTTIKSSAHCTVDPPGIVRNVNSMRLSLAQFGAPRKNPAALNWARVRSIDRLGNSGVAVAFTRDLRFRFELLLVCEQHVPCSQLSISVHPALVERENEAGGNQHGTRFFQRPNVRTQHRSGKPET